MFKLFKNALDLRQIKLMVWLDQIIYRRRPIYSKSEISWLRYWSHFESM